MAINDVTGWLSHEILLTVNMSIYAVAVLPTGAQVIWTCSCPRVSQNMLFIKPCLKKKTDNVCI